MGVEPPRAEALLAIALLAMGQIAPRARPLADVARITAGVAVPPINAPVTLAFLRDSVRELLTAGRPRCKVALTFLRRPAKERGAVAFDALPRAGMRVLGLVGGVGPQSRFPRPPVSARAYVEAAASFAGAISNITARLSVGVPLPVRA